MYSILWYSSTTVTAVKHYAIISFTSDNSCATAASDIKVHTKRSLTF